MANTETSKLKLLCLYYYFRKYVKADPPDDGTTMQEMKDYLYDLTGCPAERKSIYADIKRLNEFVRMMGLTDAQYDWIELDGQTYKRGELKGDLTFDEARLIVDAINATDFIDSGLCEKIKFMYPTHFKNGYNSVVPHDDKRVQKKRIMYLVNTIRTAIEDESVLSIKYGYLVADGIRGESDKLVSPVGLDFQNSHYYLIAVDNDAVAAGANKADAIKTYRVDRMKSARILTDQKFNGFGNKRDEVLKKYVKSSIDAYSYKGSDDRRVTITLSSEDQHMLLKAYTGLCEDMMPTIISDKIESGSITFSVEVGLVPPFFTKLFRTSMYEGVTMTIDDEQVRKQFKDHITKALDVCKD